MKVIRVGKARTTLFSLNDISVSREIATRPTLCIFNSNVRSILLYRSETKKEKKMNTAKDTDVFLHLSGVHFHDPMDQHTAVATVKESSCNIFRGHQSCLIVLNRMINGKLAKVTKKCVCNSHSQPTRRYLNFNCSKMTIFGAVES